MMMKTIIQRGMTFIAVMSLAGATGARAYDFVYGGIYFDVLSAADRTCALAQGDSDYEGRLDIPDTVYFSSGSGQPVPFTVKLINSVYGESGTSGLNGSKGKPTYSTHELISCSSIQALTVPQSVDSCYMEKTGSLTELTIADGLQPIHLRRLTRIYYQMSYPYARKTSYGNSFSGAPLERIYLGRDIASGELGDMPALTTFTIGQYLTAIPANLLGSCPQLSSITLPAGIGQVGSKAFAGCTGLRSVNVLNPEPPELPEDAFSAEAYLNAVLNIPQGSLQAYLNSNWRGFLNIREVFPTGVESVQRGADIRVDVRSGSIVVRGIASGQRISVYDMGGKLVYAGTETTIDGLPAGIYVVRAGGLSFKIQLPES